MLRYEAEVRAFLDAERAMHVRVLRVDQGHTWRGVAIESDDRWHFDFGQGDPQSVGATLCHVAAEILGEDPDGPPWN